MIAAIRPPEAFIPRRGGSEDFSSNNPPMGTHYDSGNPVSGRQNNQGFEGMSVSPDGRTLFVMNQSALRQDLDPTNAPSTRRNVRLMVYDITGAPRLMHEYAVQLPTYQLDGKTSVAAQSEMAGARQSSLAAVVSRQRRRLCQPAAGLAVSQDRNAGYKRRHRCRRTI